MKKGLVSCLLFIGFLLAGCRQKESEVLIIPQPQLSKVSSGTYRLQQQTTFSSNLPEEENQEFIEYLQASPLALQLETGDLQKSEVKFTIVAPATEKESLESYQLSVTEKGISVSAPSVAGLFYGFQTLLQLAEQGEGDTFVFPLVEIKDSPRFPYRGLHLDVSRHFRTKEFIKKQLDAMARYKLNRFHWHLTDGAGWRLEIKRYPELTEQAAYRPYPNWKAWWKGGRKYCTKDTPGAQGGYYTQEDAKEIVEYARQRHITVIPEIEMPGHSEEVLAVFPQLSCSGKPYVNSEFCIGNEDTFTFLQNVLLEVMEIFPSEYIHVGGDEADMTSWKKCPLCQKKMKEEGLSDVKELQSYLIHRMEKFLNDHNRQLLGWDEILEGGLAPRATVMSWRGEEGGISAAKAGHDVIMTPGGYCYLDAYQDAPTTQPEAIGGYLTLEKVYSYNPVPEVLTKEEAAYIQGVQANVWAEYMPTPEHMEYMIYPRLLAVAEVAWTQPDNKNWERFHRCALKEVKWLQDNGYHPFDLSKEVGERPEAASLVEHLGRMKPVKYTTPYAPQYTAGGDSALVDGYRGGWTYGDKRWQGFLNTDMDVTVDLGKVTDISSIAAEFMQLSGPYVWLPREVIISVSEDGKTFTEQQHLYTDVPTTEDRLVFRTYQWEGKASARYVRYQALSNGIEGGWLFTDEIVIK
ncbi:glycoside hydrolase family 20 protein [Bacteroides sp.]